MKKFCAVLMALAVLWCAAASADTEASLREITDEYSDEVLQYLAAFYQAEILRRMGTGFDVPAGIYVVGEDIPEGTWAVDMSGVASGVFFYVDRNSYALSDYFMMSVEPVGKIHLVAGNVVYVHGGVHFRPYTGLQGK